MIGLGVFFSIICFIGMIGEKDKTKKAQLTGAFYVCFVMTVIMYVCK